MKNLFITVQDMAGLDTLRPLTGGVPIAEGVAPEGSVFVLHDHQGNTIPLQTSVLARWNDGSVRWLLLDFQSKPPANGKVSYVLSWGENAQPKEPDVSSGLKAIQSTEKQLTLESGNVNVSLAEGALLNISGRIEVILTLTDAEGEGNKAPGWVELDDGQGAIVVALRDFWQQWPKSLEASSDGVSIGLFPRFDEGDYAHIEPWYKYQYLFAGNCYQLRTGQARRWDIWLGLDGDGKSLAKAANAPLVPAADPAQVIATGVWDAIAPAGIPEMVEYDVWAENLFKAYCHSIAAQRDYGAMNWGDWFGERQVNWGKAVCEANC